MATSRADAREALKDLLQPKLVGTGLPVKTVTDSKVKQLDGLTPLVAVLSGGTLRQARPINHPGFYLEVQVWVLQQGDGWTEAQAEDAIDEIEELIAEVYEDNRGTDEWAILEYSGRTTVTEVTSDGKMYYLEKVPTVVRTTQA